ncbi:uncharacterized protein A4U43_C05F34590 [Asparagus officinalis]|uniref:Uncharacterized protein n=1 Tax=Asparagus officinalis TaxID=4686 RepID=A0A5P1EX80_ASPOF|nr:uncharacterized protein A4U43_C05F34590 [Asparagus officinalis]
MAGDEKPTFLATPILRKAGDLQVGTEDGEGTTKEEETVTESAHLASTLGPSVTSRGVTMQRELIYSDEEIDRYRYRAVVSEYAGFVAGVISKRGRVEIDGSDGVCAGNYILLIVSDDGGKRSVADPSEMLADFNGDDRRFMPHLEGWLGLALT